MSKKYELTNETMDFNGKTLYRIRALKDFGNVKKGNLGGYVESEKNLSHDGNCWIYDKAKVYGNAIVYVNAEIYGNAIVSDNAEVRGQATVAGSAKVYDNAWVFGDAQVFNDAKVYGNAKVFNDAKVYGNANVFNDAIVYDNAQVFDNAWVFGVAQVFGDAKACGDAKVFNYARIGGDALIKSSRDFSLVSSFGSENRTSTFFRCDDGLIRVNCGCFHGTIDEFRKRVIKTHGNNKYAKEYLMIADLMELRFSNVK